MVEYYKKLWHIIKKGDYETCQSLKSVANKELVIYDYISENDYKLIKDENDADINKCKNMMIPFEDYYLDLFVSGNIKLEANALRIHTIDGFMERDIEVSSDIKMGIECGGSLVAKIGRIKSIEAEFTGEAYALWTITQNSVTNVLQCKYQGLYATIKTRFKNGSKDENSSDDYDTPSPEEKFLLHDGFTYEFKID